MVRGSVGNRGFTLAEMLVASTIGGFIALVAVGAFKAVSDSAEVVNNMTETASELRFAARYISLDLANLYRDRNAQNTKLIAMPTGSQSGGTMLTMYSVNRAKARPGHPEGDVYEVEYLLMKGRDESGESAEGRNVLFRRLWPYPDEEVQPGGVLIPIAENIDVFDVRFFDGQQWAGEWPEEMTKLPDLVEVTIVARQKGRREPVIETLIANFPRIPSRQAGSSAPTGQAGQEPQQSSPAPQGGPPSGGPPPGDGGGGQRGEGDGGRRGGGGGPRR